MDSERLCDYTDRTEGSAVKQRAGDGLIIRQQGEYAHEQKTPRHVSRQTSIGCRR